MEKVFTILLFVQMQSLKMQSLENEYLDLQSLGMHTAGNAVFRAPFSVCM